MTGRDRHEAGTPGGMGGQFRPGAQVTQNGHTESRRGTSVILAGLQAWQARSPVTGGQSVNEKPAGGLQGTGFYSMTQHARHTAHPGSVTVTTASPRAGAGPEQLDGLAHPVSADPVVNAAMPSQVLITPGSKVAGMPSALAQIPVQGSDPAGRMQMIGHSSSGIDAMWRR